MKIQESMRGQLPRVEPPQAYRSPDGKIQGWRVSIPGQRPLATPAVVDGKVFLGGGFGSYEFYAFDARCGGLLWQYQTSDDGPTAAVVADGHVVFNTESCELEVLTTAGQAVWKKWLGDPLMSMPAVDAGRVYMAYPQGHQHYLACFDLKSGKEYWKQPIAGEIITAPVIAAGRIYLTTLEGTISCFESDGRPVWQEQKNATSSPVVWESECYFSRREEVPLSVAGHAAELQQTETLAARAVAAGATTRAYGATQRKADYLDHGKRQARSPAYAASMDYDSHVGFAIHKGSAKMEQAMRNLGHGHVSAVWAYQGSKPFVWHGRLYAAMGDTLSCVDPRTEQLHWKQALRDGSGEDELLDSVSTPPVLVNGKIFLGTIQGQVMCRSAETGELLWQVDLGEPIQFQPAVAAGRLYAGTSRGSLYCLETGDPNDDGWLMWGATPQHNGAEGIKKKESGSLS